MTFIEYTNMQNKFETTHRVIVGSRTKHWYVRDMKIKFLLSTLDEQYALKYLSK